MFRGAALGVVFLGCIYVAGFIYKIGYFGAVSLETSWLRMVEVDYLYAGVYAIFESSKLIGVHIVMVIIAYAASLTYIDKVILYSQKSMGLILSTRIKKEAVKVFSFFSVLFVYYVATLLIMIFAGVMIANVVALGEEEVYEFLSSKREDRLCNHVENECYNGKLLYTNNTSYIFFVDAEDGDVRHGKIKIAEQRHSDVEIGWHEKSVERYLKHN